MTKLYVSLISALVAARQRQDDEQGAAAVEYGMLVALIAAVIISTVALLGPKIKDAFQAVVDALTGAGV
jgi:pilus assembly protein Flp/PilA